MREWIVKKSVLLCSILVAIAFLATMGRTAIQSIAGLAVAGSGSQWINLQDISVGTPITAGAADVGLFGYNGTSWDALKTATIGNTVTATGLGASAIYGEFLTVLPTLTNGTYGALQFDSSGRITLGTSTASIGAVTSAGTKTPTDAFANPTDASDMLSFSMGWNGATWDRLASGANNADGEAVRTLGVQEVDSYLRGFNGTTFDRLKSEGNNADGVATSTLGSLMQKAYTMLFNGTTWDRQRGDTTNGAWVNVKSSVDPSLATSIFNGQLGLSATAVVLPTNTSKQFCVEALAGNANKVYLGTSTVTVSGATGGLELTPGSSRCYTLSNTNLVYAISTATGNTVSFDGIN